MSRAWGALTATLLFAAFTILPAAAQQAAGESAAPQSAAAQPSAGETGGQAPSSSAATSQAAGSEQNAGGQATASTDTVPADPNESYRVAVSVFHGDGLSPDNDYLTRGLPLLLEQTVSALSQHHFDDAELAAYREEIAREAIAAQEETINALLEKRASILFESSDPTKQLAASTTELEAARKRLAYLKSFDRSKIEVKRTKPVELVHGSGAEPLVPYPVLSPAATARQMKLQLLVTGSVVQVENYLVVHIEVFNRALDRTVYDFKRAFSTSNVMNAASDASKHIARAVLGRAFGTLDLTIHPASALVYLDGNFYGVGSATIPYIATGRHEIEARAPGYRTQKLEVSVDSFSQTNRAITLAAVTRPELVITSLPAGADVYLASRWQGKTPLAVPRPAGDEALTLQKAGYHDYTTTLSPSSPRETRVQLLPEVVDSQKRVRDLRSRFYTSFGIFALSLIAPVSFYSVTQQDLLDMQLTTSVPEYERLKKQFGVWYYAFLGSAFVSSALFTNTVIDIFDYLRAIR